MLTAVASLIATARPMHQDGATTFVEALGDLWATLLVLVIGLAVVYFRKEIKQFLAEAHLFRFRARGNSFEVQRPRNTQHETTQPLTEVAATAAPQSEKVENAASTSQLEPVQQMMLAFFDRNISEAERLYKEIQHAESDRETKTNVEALYLAYRFQYAGDGSAIKRLESLADTAEFPVRIHMWIAWCYRSTSETERALTAYEEALASARSDEGRANAAEGIMYCYAEIGNFESAVAIAETVLAAVSDESAKRTLYRSLAATYKTAKDELFRAIALEKVVELMPADPGARFDAAYSQSESGLNEIAMNNYRELLGFKPDHLVAKNNLGVAYKALDLPILAIDQYREAQEAGNALAAANLAYEYIEAGFEREASEVIEKVKNCGDPPTRLAYAIAEVSARRQAEGEKVGKVKSEGEKKSRFLRAFADAYFVNAENARFSAVGWITEKGEAVELSRDGSKFKATWKSGKSDHTLAGGLRNRGARVTHSISAPWDEYFADRGTREGLAYLSHDGRRIRVMASENATTEYFELLCDGVTSTG